MEDAAYEMPTELTFHRLLGTGTLASPLVASSGRLVVEELLGVGESAFVYRVRDGGGRTYALKLARPGWNDVLLAEARALTLGAGPGLVRLRAPLFCEPGAVGLLLAELTGPPLDGWAESITDPGERLRAAQDVFFALAAVLHRLHGLRFTHGDIKPANVIVTSDGPTLLDLGLAGSGAEFELPQGFTPAFAAPEVLAGGRAGPRADVYSLAATVVAVFPEIAAELQPFLAPAPDKRAPTPQVGSARYLLRTALLRVRLPVIETEVALADFSHPMKLAVREGPVSEELAGAARGLLAVTYVSLLVHSRAPIVVSAEPVEGLPRSLDVLSAGERALFFGFLIGAAAVHLQFSGTDSELWGLLGEVAEIKPLAAVSQGDLQGNRVPLPSQDDVLGLALLAGAGRVPGPTLALMAERSDLPVRLQIEAARVARRQGHFEVAHQLLDRALEFGELPIAQEGMIAVERAYVWRRQGQPTFALREMEDLEQRIGLDPEQLWGAQACSLLGRFSYDHGEYELARRWAERAPLSVECREVLALVAIAEGRPGDAIELSQATALSLGDDEARSRLDAVLGMAHQVLGQLDQARHHFERAVRAAQRVSALVEEATYLTGLAAVAADAFQYGLALSASERAALLFEALGQGPQAARALLARAAVLAALGQEGELVLVAERAYGLAEVSGDTRCQGYLDLCLFDGLTEETARHAAALRAWAILDDPDDRLRADARLYQWTGREGPESDQIARTTAHADAAAEWWNARADRALRFGASDPHEIVARVLDLASRRSSSALGMAVVNAADLALSIGQPDSARRLLEHASTLAQRFLAGVPELYRSSAASRPWVARALARPTGEFSLSQLEEVAGLLRILSHRDGLRSLLRQVLDLMILWTGVERGLIMLRAPGGKLVIREARNLRRNDLPPEQRRLSQTLAERALVEGRPVSVVDAAADLSDVYRSVHLLHLRSVLAVPLTAGGETFGVAYLDDRAKPAAFGAAEVAWAALIANIAALAIADTRDRLILKRAERRAARAGVALARALEGSEATRERLTRQLAELPQVELRSGMVAESQAMRTLVEVARKVGSSDLPLLICGESGSGKELIARAVAESSNRASRPFLAENCAALPENLLESELFGHVRGAFTGAVRDRAGLFEMADGGTLFLDEVGEMSLPMQAKLLRVLQDGGIRRIGSDKARKVDVRVIAATHRDITAMVKAGTFREDLYYRLNVVPLQVPSLRERREDILPLVRHFLRLYGAGREVNVAAGAARALLDFDWPGNVRQLENEIRRLLVFVDTEITASDLRLAGPGPISAPPASTEPRTIRERMDELERKLVLAALDEYQGNRTKMAEALGMSRHGLLKMMKRLGIADPA